MAPLDERIRFGTFTSWWYPPSEFRPFSISLPAGREPVREWLKGRIADDRKIIGTDIKDVDFAWPLGKPLVDSLGRGLWEVRSAITDGIARVIFYVDGDRMVLLHAFVKKRRRLRPERSTSPETHEGMTL